MPLAAILSFDAGRPVTTHVEISDGNELMSIDFDADPSSGLPILGMKAGRTYQVTVLATDESGEVLTIVPLEYTPPPLPDGLGDFPADQSDNFKAG